VRSVLDVLSAYGRDRRAQGLQYAMEFAHRNEPLAHALEGARSATAAKGVSWPRVARIADTIERHHLLQELPSRWSNLGRSPRNSAPCGRTFLNSSRHLLPTDQRYSRPAKVEAGAPGVPSGANRLLESVGKCALIRRWRRRSGGAISGVPA